MKTHKFDSQFRLGEPLDVFSEEIVKNEPMLFSATPRFAYQNGGPITRNFLEKALGLNHFGSKLDNPGMCFDSRVHMLMPGWFPCIPGWHHDDVPRTRSDGQPNYDTPEFQSQHILGLINGNICPTEFAVGKTAMPDIPLGKTIYKHWHHEVEQDIQDGVLQRVQVPTNFLIHFNNQSFHQGTRAVAKGWRWFGRLSWDAGYEQGRPHANEIRRQVNVYLDMPMEGW